MSASMPLPDCETLLVSQKNEVLFVTLNRPQCRNAMSLQMVEELMAVFGAVRDNVAIRTIVLRGSDGHFCAGGDIKDMAGARQQAAEDGNTSAFYTLNRRFGEMICQANEQPQVVVAMLEGAILGGGFGLACVSDVAIAHEQAQFGLPETGLGILPAQIAPFVVQRIGLTQARRLALTGARFDGLEACRLGIVHETANNEAALESALSKTLDNIRRCAPHANRNTKALVHAVAIQEKPLTAILDDAATGFANAVTGEEGAEGTIAFMQKRQPNWAKTDTDNHS